MSLHMNLSDLPPLQGQFREVRSSVEAGQRADPFGIPGYGMLSERDNFHQDPEIRNFDENDGEEAVKCLRRCFQLDNFHQDPEIWNFDENDGEEAVKCLQRCFQVLNPGTHVAKRLAEDSSISFVHCRHTGHLGKRYVQLRAVMEERARLQLLRDCVNRVKLASTFVRDIQNIVLEEYKMLYTVTHDCVQEIPTSKIFCLNGLCEDLRTHIGHWNCIKQKLHTSRWLQPILGSLYFQLDSLRMTLNKLRDKAIFWMEKFIVVGLQVFAHSNVDALTHELIWNITRGLEDFNNIVSGVHNGGSNLTSQSSIEYSGMLRQKELVMAESTNGVTSFAENIRAIPFAKVLQILADERSKYAALETHRFFTTNDEFVRLLYSGRLPEYMWSEETSGSADRVDRDTSDYHTATGSMTSLSAAVLKVGGIRAPDLSNCNSPLVDLAQREHSFAQNFLLIVCNSTNLLQKKEPAKSRRGVKISQSMSCAKPPRGDTPVLSRNDSLRKSVSWGDSADLTIRSQLIARYMDQYWGHFGVNLGAMFWEPSWVRQKSLYFSELGNILLHTPTVMALVKHTMQHVCLKVTQCKEAPAEASATAGAAPTPGASTLLSHPDKLGWGPPPHPGRTCWGPSTPLFLSGPLLDLFPSGSVTPMLSAANRCLHVSAFGAWDRYMCEALGSNRSDKCYPCPLVNGDYSTRTGMLLRDTYQPMLNLLREHLADTADISNNEMLSRVSEMVAVTTRLLATSSSSFQWCRCKTHQFLASMSVGNFLLVSQTDLKILVDETKSSLYQVQMFTKAASQKLSAEDQLVQDLRKVGNQVNVVLDNLQSLPGLCMKQFSLNCNTSGLEYFKGNMPSGKVWKKKQDAELPKDHNIYIEHVLETVLEPVLEGVGKLKQTVQLSVVSLATEALCQAYMTHILRERIKFSYAGACQLALDVKYLKKWLSDSIVNESVRASILDLSVLKTLQGAVMILMKQPSKRPHSKFRDGERETSMDSMTDSYIQGERSVHEIEDCVGHVTNPDDWMALRVQGGVRGWRGLSSCLNPET